MRTLVAVLSLAALAACSSPCEDLGKKFCSCYSGTTKDTCENQVSKQLDAANPSGAQEDYCQARLDECHAPSGASFCDWIETAAGKESCGLAYPSDAPLAR